LLPQELRFTRAGLPFQQRRCAQDFFGLTLRLWTPMTTSLKTTRRQRPNGFTLMELLIVISIMLILMLLAIPNFNRMKISVNEKSAINSLQVIYKDQISYQTDYPQNGFACSLQALGGDPKTGTPSPTSAQLLQGDLQSGVKDGYIFNIVNCSKVTVNNVDQITGYEVTAVPQAVGKTGNQGYCIDQFSQIKSDPQGGTNCTQSRQ
jgi:type IV pilus assembly protein PilA